MTVRNEKKALGLLSVLMLAGAGLLTIPWFITAPAYLDLALRDPVFGADLSTRRVTVTDVATGKTMTAAVQKMGSAFVARIGRINSGRGSYTARIDGYKPGTARVEAAALQTVRVPVDLTPVFGRLEISPVNATRTDEPVAAVVKEGTRAVTPQPQRVVIVDLPPGMHRLSAQASGFCGAEKEFEVSAGKITRAVLPLSPDLKDDEIARFVLGWRNEPRDLDSHLRKVGIDGFPHPAHVYFSHKVGSLPGGATFARLDVDELYPGRYETVTVRSTPAGELKYFVHLFSGSGTISSADATVQVYTRGCEVRTFTPPPNCARRFWNVATLRQDSGRVELAELGSCDDEFAIGRGVVKPNE